MRQEGMVKKLCGRHICMHPKTIFSFTAGGKAASNFGRPRRVPVEVGGVCRDQKLDRHGSQEDDTGKSGSFQQRPGTRSTRTNDIPLPSSYCPLTLPSRLLSYGTIKQDGKHVQ